MLHSAFCYTSGHGRIYSLPYTSLSAFASQLLTYHTMHEQGIDHVIFVAAVEKKLLSGRTHPFEEVWHQGERLLSVSRCLYTCIAS